MTATPRLPLARRRGGAIEVCFGDGRFFHRFLPEDQTAGDVHLCPPDTYRVRYDFRPLAALAGRVAGDRAAKGLRHGEPLPPGGRG